MENEGKNKPFDAGHMKDLITYAAYHFENGVRTVAEYSKKMMDEFGWDDWIKPHLEEAWKEFEAKTKPKIEIEETKGNDSSIEINENHFFKDVKFEKKTEDVDMAINPFIKKSLAIFIFLAIIISLFPPFEFGNEKLRTISERSYSSLFSLTLPVKKYDFIFGGNKKSVLLEHPYNKNLSREYLLDRKILFGELLVEYILAFFVSIALGYGFRSKRMSFLVLPNAIKRSLKIYFSTGRLWSGKK